MYKRKLLHICTSKCIEGTLDSDDDNKVKFVIITTDKTKLKFSETIAVQLVKDVHIVYTKTKKG